MKYYKLGIALAAMITVPAMAADVGVSLSIGQPGFYGQIDIGGYSRPPVLYAKPVVIQRIPRGEVREPLYLRVPSSHARNWRRYCSRYDACGRPVYFVRDDWYSNVYAPHYREQHRDDRRDGYNDHHDHDGHDDHDHDHDHDNRDGDRDRRHD